MLQQNSVIKITGSSSFTKNDVHACIFPSER